MADTQTPRDRVPESDEEGALMNFATALALALISSIAPRTKDAPGQSLKATGRSGYSNSELMSGGA
jgi:hypothetical protein